MAELFKMKLLDVNKNQILPETSADQVTMAGGGNVEAKIKSLESAFASGINLRGTVGSGGTVETLPADSYKLGDMYVVLTDGTYASQVCEPGDLILCASRPTPRRGLLIPTGPWSRTTWCAPLRARKAPRTAT